jgi:hypothetical protein
MGGGYDHYVLSHLYLTEVFASPDPIFTFLLTPTPTTLSPSHHLIIASYQPAIINTIAINRLDLVRVLDLYGANQPLGGDSTSTKPDLLAAVSDVFIRFPEV